MCFNKTRLYTVVNGKSNRMLVLDANIAEISLGTSILCRRLDVIIVRKSNSEHNLIYIICEKQRLAIILFTVDMRKLAITQNNFHNIFAD